ncbi:MAG: cob(I)yrinic acid a,c-diamide adenosyltransferase [Bacteroidales bacterium]
MTTRKSNVYTKTGDKGYTSLVGGQRILKSDLRLDSYGTVDELNSFIGLLLCELGQCEEKSLLIEIQKKLFAIGSILATESKGLALKYGCQITAKDVFTIENAIDEIDSNLPPLKYFVLPGGSKSGSLAHVCRTICRRAERQIIALSTDFEIDDLLLIYVNRLSDLLFVLARKLSLSEKANEIFWNTAND